MRWVFVTVSDPLKRFLMFLACSCRFWPIVSFAVFFLGILKTWYVPFCSSLWARTVKINYNQFVMKLTGCLWNMRMKYDWLILDIVDRWLVDTDKLMPSLFYIIGFNLQWSRGTFITYIPAHELQINFQHSSSSEWRHFWVGNISGFTDFASVSATETIQRNFHFSN